MHFLVDENIAAVFTNWLRAEGHDLVLASTLGAGETDEHWLSLAERNHRIILTTDKDFGELIFRDKLNSHGVILLRLFDMPISARLTRLQQAWSVVEANPSGCFIVITSKRVRVRRIA